MLYSSFQVYICSNSVEARQKVIELARQLSFIPVDMGTLSLAKEIENMPLRLFSDWKGPVLTAVALSIFCFAYSFIRDIIHPYVKNRQSFFYKIPLEMVNRTLPVVAITLLALVYLAGQLAAAHQVFYGTKFRRFPCWLQGWLQSRKQLGLLSFFFACVHVLYSLCLPMRRSERYLLLNMAYQQVCHCQFSFHLCLHEKSMLSRKVLLQHDTLTYKCYRNLQLTARHLRCSCSDMFQICFFLFKSFSVNNRRTK